MEYTSIFRISLLLMVISLSVQVSGRLSTGLNRLKATRASRSFFSHLAGFAMLERANFRRSIVESPIVFTVLENIAPRLCWQTP